ncbi:MAG: UTP--glucose-1-phosphate uridylyltransferase [Patescibacteria group bacterium]
MPIPIRRAVIPVAGFGTRFLPATKAQPKEMLSVVDKPVVQYLVEEAVASGIEEIIFVTGRNKRAIEDHFDYSADLDQMLRARGKTKTADALRRLEGLARFVFVRQNEPRGPGDALLCVRNLLRDEPFAVLYGDDLVDAKVPCLRQLMDVYEEYGAPVCGLYRVASRDVTQYGMIRGARANRNKKLWTIHEMVEKPKMGEAPSRLAGIGKYIYTPELYRTLAGMTPKENMEFYPTDAFNLYIKNNGVMYGYEFDGIRHDCGSKLGFLQAVIHYGRKHPDIGREFRAYLARFAEDAKRR